MVLISNGSVCWQQDLNDDQYRITRLKKTEPPYSGKYHNFSRPGTYHCVCCGNTLFRSEEKFAAPSKWPAFWAPFGAWSVQTEKEVFHFVARNAVSCNRCSAHLGYVFEDGRPPTGVRYFINSAALMFVNRGAVPTGGQKREQRAAAR